MKPAAAVRPAALALLAALSGAPAIAAVPAAWWTLQSRSVQLDARTEPVGITVLDVDLRAAELRVVSVPLEAAGVAAAGSELSLREFGQTLARHPKYRGRTWIAVNGGFSSYAANVPLGLLVSDGRVYSTLALEKRRDRATDPKSEFGALRWSGILCQPRAGARWEVVAAARYRPGSCWQALQAGPVLVEPDRRPGITPDEPSRGRPYLRTVVCLDDGDRVRIVLAGQQTHLLPLSRWLARPEAQGGAGCRAAINLAGDSSSGLAVHADGLLRFAGEGGYAIPSALVFTGRQR